MACPPPTPEYGMTHELASMLEVFLPHSGTEYAVMIIAWAAFAAGIGLEKELTVIDLAYLRLPNAAPIHGQHHLTATFVAEMDAKSSNAVFHQDTVRDCSLVSFLLSSTRLRMW